MQHVMNRKPRMVRDHDGKELRACDPLCRLGGQHAGLCAGPSGKVGKGTPGLRSKRTWKKEGRSGSLKAFRCDPANCRLFLRPAQS